MTQTVIYIRSLLQGGAEKQALLLAEEMQRTARVLLVVHTHDTSRSHQDYSRINNIVFLEGSNASKFSALYKLLKREKVQNLVCFLPVNNIIGTFAAKMAGTPNILCGIRGSKSKGKMKTALLKFICNRLGVRFISNNEKSREVYIGRGFNGNHISVIHNGIQIPDAARQITRSMPEKPFRLAAVGRFIPEKDFPMMLRAVHHLACEKGFTDFLLTIAGYGPLETEIRTQIEQLGLEKHVQLIDGQTADLQKLYTSSDLYLLSSAHEGMPNTVMEAMSYKLPVVSTDAGDAGALVSSGKNGFLIHIGDHLAMAESILKVFESAALYEDLCRHSFEKISTEFSTGRLAAEYAKYLKA